MSARPRSGLTAQMSSPVGIMSMGLVTITLFYIGYRKGLEPIMKKKKMKESEEFADLIYKQEVKTQSDQLG